MPPFRLMRMATIVIPMTLTVRETTSKALSQRRSDGRCGRERPEGASTSDDGRGADSGDGEAGWRSWSISILDEDVSAAVPRDPERQFARAAEGLADGAVSPGGGHQEEE